MRGLKGAAVVYKEIVFSGEDCPANLATRGVPERCARITVEPDARNKGLTVIFKNGQEIQRIKQTASLDMIDFVKDYAVSGAPGEQCIATFYQYTHAAIS